MTTDISSMHWDTTRLYPGPTATELEADFAAGSARAEAFRTQYQGKIADLDDVALLEALSAYEALEELLTKPQLYAYLLFAADSGDDTVKRLSQRAAEFGNRMGRELLFFDLELIHLPDDRFAALTGDSRFAGYCHYLASLRKFRPHTLAGMGRTRGACRGACQRGFAQKTCARVGQGTGRDVRFREEGRHCRRKAEHRLGPHARTGRKYKPGAGRRSRAYVP